MSEFVVPAIFEQTLNLSDGSSGPSLSEALQFDRQEVSNLYSYAEGLFQFAFTDCGVGYGDTEASTQQAKTSFQVEGSKPCFSLHFDPTPVEKWGINFAGTVRVSHEGGVERVIYLPGTRTYDPAGLTGDPHASERIGPSCSRSQSGVSIGELVAALNGAELEQINAVQEQVRPLILHYHGRECLFDWMRLQVEEAIYKNKDVTPYPEFIKALIRHGKLELTAAREHTRAYLQTYNEGHPRPPLQYYKKVAAKDKVDEIFNTTDLKKFQQIVQT